jgi:hypothetical protein
MKDMITTGLIMNIFGLMAVYLAANTWLKLIFDLRPFINTITTTRKVLNSTCLP